MPETYFSFGIYREFLQKETKNNYNASGLGMMFGFNQHIRGIWSGGAEIRWSDWIANTQFSYENTSPLSLFSKVSASPDMEQEENKLAIFKILHPYATAGIGYTMFFDNRSVLSARSKTAFGQFSATYGGGLKIALPTSFAVKIGLEQWRGIQTTSYFANMAFIALSFGDVDKF